MCSSGHSIHKIAVRIIINSIITIMVVLLIRCSGFFSKILLGSVMIFLYIAKQN